MNAVISTQDATDIYRRWQNHVRKRLVRTMLRVFDVMVHIQQVQHTMDVIARAPIQCSNIVLVRHVLSDVSVDAVERNIENAHKQRTKCMVCADATKVLIDSLMRAWGLLGEHMHTLDTNPDMRALENRSSLREHEDYIVDQITLAYRSANATLCEISKKSGVTPPYTVNGDTMTLRVERFLR